MSKSVKAILVVVLVAVIIYLVSPTLFGLLEDNSTTSNSAQSAGPIPGIPVSGMVVSAQKIDNKIVVTGSIVANESVELKSEISGLVRKIHFKEGAKVRKGTLLVSLDDEEILAQLEKTRHNHKLMQEMEKRQSLLLEKEAISQEEYDIALTELNTVVSDIKILQSQYEKTKIKAPFDGTIGLRHISEGSYLTPNEPIASLYNIDPVKIDFTVPEKYSRQVQTGDEIRFTIDAMEEPGHGKIYAIEPHVDPETRTLRMRALSPNPKGTLLPGQFAKVELIFNTMEQALMIPTEAVVPELGGHRVFVSRGGMVESKTVEVGIRNANSVQIVNGLASNDTVITSGILQIRPGSQVELTITQ